ncbi:unnamed protein product [Ceratitis capitata]|uniref:(Mediterranean fruit fly) hypothetical protein n=1 Tax=Ceratitis capitata TaxID=7213 RepID=A0A811UGT9_CERCA|nr:unnamed protein product [Ceratitis capitata]
MKLLRLLWVSVLVVTITTRYTAVAQTTAAASGSATTAAPSGSATTAPGSATTAPGSATSAPNAATTAAPNSNSGLMRLGRSQGCVQWWLGNDFGK